MDHTNKSTQLMRGTIIALLLLSAPQLSWAQQIRVGDICRVKGQEENTLHGLGLVVGLNGTGDNETPTMRALAKMLELMGNPLTQNSSGNWNIDELSNTRNVAMVMVTATIPSGGARQGDTIHCSVNAVSATSLEGGYLMITPLLGPRPDNPRVYAFCGGPIALDPKGPQTAGKIHKGCRLEEDFRNAFVRDDKVTLVLEKAHASFQTADAIAEKLNESTAVFWAEPRAADGEVVSAAQNQEPRNKKKKAVYARALDPVNVEVLIPPVYLDSPVQFVAHLLEARILPPENSALVIVDKRSGVVIVGEDVTIGKVAVSHNNISVQTGDGAADGPLYLLDQDGDTTRTRLDALVKSLNALRLSSDDIISIIENLNESRALYGRLEVR